MISTIMLSWKNPLRTMKDFFKNIPSERIFVHILYRCEGAYDEREFKRNIG